MERIFRKYKMIERLKNEGRINQVKEDDYKLMELLDGEVGNDYNYRSFVYDEPLVWIEETDKHPGAYVNIADCD